MNGIRCRKLAEEEPISLAHGFEVHSFLVDYSKHFNMYIRICDLFLGRFFFLAIYLRAQILCLFLPFC
jgi:hypothetical protein